MTKKSDDQRLLDQLNNSVKYGLLSERPETAPENTLFITPTSEKYRFLKGEWVQLDEPKPEAVDESEQVDSTQ